MKSETVLIIGSNGQIGTELVIELRKQLGAEHVIASDLNAPHADFSSAGPFELLNVLDGNRLNEIVVKHKVTQIYHLAATLSATAEKNPKFAWTLNMDGLFNVLDVSKARGISKIFWPSSIAVFGPTTPKDNTPQYTIMEPSSIYGISKLAGERWCEYYFLKHKMDIRSIRYPGLIGYKSEPGGGTTDYAVHIFHEALSKHSYECFLAEDTMLPMMYMSDAIRGTLMLMDAQSEKIKIRSSYNFAGVSFTPKDVAAEIRKRIPDFNCTYVPDFRQKLAESWPRSINDSSAKEEWNWNPAYDLAKITEDMLRNIPRMQSARSSALI